jgi:mannose/cellobiose epimerase-like protein (N-acyl-D-glucosamine 2-epimerase family)/anti-anti-sigma regulatory factor
MSTENKNLIQTPFSDSIAGYVVTGIGQDKRTFTIKTGDERIFEVKLADAYGVFVRNLDEAVQPVNAPLESLIIPGNYLFAYGIYYPEGQNLSFEVKQLIFMGRTPQEYRFEEPDWWIQQIRALARFYFNAQFPDGVVEMRNYRTSLSLEGAKTGDNVQETDTISRMVYGFASAYMLTGEERYLEMAERGTEYLRDHMRGVDQENDIVYWYHAIEKCGKYDRKIYASSFGDDKDGIPAYEQIYALAGPVQTYRITGDPRILDDTNRTINFFDKHFRDYEKGGYFSHIDPETFDPRSESLGENRARKNWNSVGDHAPAYLINLWLATGEQRYADFLTYTADTIVEHFPDFENSPFVQERFHEDWSHDTTYKWQQDRAVVGHDLKIAWNLMRIHHLFPKDSYVQLAQRLAEIMPRVGMDRQHGGWYDVMERKIKPGEETHRLSFHDRKAWWQQEQGILAYQILFGSLRLPEHQRLARESAAFYNAFVPDHDSGGVYFNVLGNGLPYVMGDERFKGNHSMSGYHAFELCYLATVYENLLINKKPMDLYFKPRPDGFKDRILRVQPDILPVGTVQLTGVWINDAPYSDYDANALTIKLPDHQETLKVRVRIAPTALPFDAMIDKKGDVVVMTLLGDLNDTMIKDFKAALERVISLNPKRLILRGEGLDFMSAGAGRVLSKFSDRSDLHLAENINMVGANEQVRSTLKNVGLEGEIIMKDAHEPDAEAERV